MAIHQPRLREGLDFFRLRNGSYLLSDGERGGQFTLQEPEVFLCKLMDGTRSLAAVQEGFHDRFGSPLELRNLAEFVEQLRSGGLLADSRAPLAVAPPSRDVRLVRLLGPRGLNRLLDLAVLLTGWVVHPAWCLPVLLGGLAAVGALIANFDLYLEELRILVLDLPLPVVVFSVLLRVLVVDSLCTFGRSVAMRKHGARLQSFDLMLHRRLIPYFFSEAGDTFARLDPRGQWASVITPLAVELALGAFAVMAWLYSAWGSVPRAFCLVLTIPVFAGLLLQLNPFTRLDAYRILARLVDRPRLYENARAETRAWLVLRPGPLAVSSRERFWLRVYGVGTYVSSVALTTLFVVGGTWLLTTLYGAAGAYGLALIGIVWYWHRIWHWIWHWPSFGNAMTKEREGRPPGRSRGMWFLRWVFRLGLLAVIVLAGFLPYDHEVAGDCRLVPAAQVGVRAQIEDEIIEVFVAEGDVVKQGDLVARQSGRELRSDISTTEARLRRAQADLDELRAGPRTEDIEIAAFEVQRLKSDLEFAEAQLERETDLQAENSSSEQQVDEARSRRDSVQQQALAAEKNLEKLRAGSREESIRAAEAAVEEYESELARFRRDLDLTVLRSPIAGRVVTPHVRDRLGQVAARGELIAEIQDTDPLRVAIAADEEAAAVVRPGMRVKVRLRSIDGALLLGRIESAEYEVEPRSAIETSTIRTDTEQYREEVLDRDTGEYTLTLYAALDDPSDQLVVGMSGKVRVVVEESYIWRELFRPVARFCRTEVWSWLP